VGAELLGQVGDPGQQDAGDTAGAQREA